MLRHVRRFIFALLFYVFSEQSLAFCQGPVESTSQNVVHGSELLIFVSFSMPEQSLKLWSEQAAKVGAKLLLRGFFEDSLQRTVNRAGELFGKQASAELLIDPEAFQQFNVQSVPAIVVTKREPCLREDCPPPVFDLVYGDSDLESALRLITVKGSHDVKEWANQFLKQYRAANET